MHVTLDGFTMVHVQALLTQVPGTADNCGGRVTVLTTFNVVCPVLVNVKLRTTDCPSKRLHGLGVGVWVGVGVCMGAQTRRPHLWRLPGWSVAELSTRNVHVPWAFWPLKAARLASGR